jgi:hypothetical protein
MYTEQILWFISWPVLIWFSYKMASLAVKKFEKNEATD